MPETTGPLGPGMFPLPEGDAYTALTRLVYAGLPPGPDARACVLRSGTTVMVVRPGLTRRARRLAVRAELERLGAWRGAAWVLVAADAARRAAQPAQRAMHTVQHLPHAVVENISGPAVITVTGAVLALSAAGGAVKFSGIMDGPRPAGPPVGSPSWHRHHPVHVKLPSEPLTYLGVYEPTSPGSYAGIDAFAQLAGRRPNLALYYSSWGEPFQALFAGAAAAAGAIPVVQWNPEIGADTAAGISLADIASGGWDDYLTEFADAVATYGRAVVISFGPEVNGTWYPWSSQPAADYVAAWRHIVGVFRMQGAGNVTWMWTVNRVSATASGDLSRWWPGSRYVAWAGVDGYYRHPRDTWDFVFAPTIGALRQFTAAPILIAETAIGPPGTEPSQLTDMYANIRAGSYLGLVWFDQDKPGLPYRLDTDPGAVRVFREETEAWRLQHQVARASTSAGVGALGAGGLGGAVHLAGDPAPERGNLRRVVTWVHAVAQATVLHRGASAARGGGGTLAGEKPRQFVNLALQCRHPLAQAGDLLDGVHLYRC